MDGIEAIASAMHGAAEDWINAHCERPEREDACDASPALLPSPESPGVRLMPKHTSCPSSISERDWARNKPRLTKEQEDEFLARYFAGETMRSLSAEFGVGRMYYDHLLKRRWLERRPPVNRAKPKPPKKSKSELFWERVDVKDDPEQCWEWQRYCDPNGYGRVSFQGDSEYAHRVAWMLANGVTEIPDGVEVRHQCDNPPCCNPAHLLDGTHLDNMRDREERGRGKGAENLRKFVRPRTFTDEQESRIVELYQCGSPGTDLATEFNVTPAVIYRVLRRHGVKVRRQGRHTRQDRPLHACRSAVAQ